MIKSGIATRSVLPALGERAVHVETYSTVFLGAANAVQDLEFGHSAHREPARTQKRKDALGDRRFADSG